jgi:hypothetical protein
MPDYTAILTRNYSAEWTLNGDNYEGLVWLDKTSKPTKSELDALWDKTKAELDAEAKAKVSAKAALLTKLGITADEAALLLG